MSTKTDTPGQDHLKRSIQRMYRSAAPPGSQRAMLFYLLSKRCSADELATIAFNLGIEIENLPGDNRIARARELVLYFEHRDELDRLEQELVRVRPDLKPAW